MASTSPNRAARSLCIRTPHQAVMRALLNVGAPARSTDVLNALPATAPVGRSVASVNHILNTLHHHGYVQRTERPDPVRQQRTLTTYTPLLDFAHQLLHAPAKPPLRQPKPPAPKGAAPAKPAGIGPLLAPRARAITQSLLTMAFDVERAAAYHRARQRAQSARRPGSMTFMDWPSRAGSELRWPDGRRATSPAPVRKGDA